MSLDDPVYVDNQQKGYGIDPISTVDGRMTLERDVLDGDLVAVELACLLPGTGARITRGRGEQHDQPRRVGPHEVGPIELSGHHKPGRSGRIGPPALQHRGNQDSRDHDGGGEEGTLHGRQCDARRGGSELSRAESRPHG
ncbi:MAG: hypothetical protein ACRDPR_13705 [Nocardioidaceae bacterium]